MPVVREFITHIWFHHLSKSKQKNAIFFTLTLLKQIRISKYFLQTSLATKLKKNLFSRALKNLAACNEWFFRKNFINCFIIFASSYFPSFNSNSPSLFSPNCRTYELFLNNHEEDTDSAPFLRLSRNYKCTCFCYNRPEVECHIIEDNQEVLIGKIVNPFFWCDLGA